MHEQLWDDDRGMVRLYGLHLVRETALGAFLDLEHGEVARAQRALREVLQCQYPANADPRWAGTFKTHANQADAGTPDADGRLRDREWRDYDPNWRQFLAMILWVTERLYGHVLADDLRSDMQRAVHDAARSEPTDRVAAAYTNIALMHTWLCDATDQTCALGDAVAAQLHRDGDIAEYNSPTYDAISLMAGCLLADFGRTTTARQLGEQSIHLICSRLHEVWHPGFALQAGPHVRSYGLDPHAYVSLMSVLMAAIDVPAAGPTRLDNDTTHVHDLYFLPLFTRLCARLRKAFTVQPVVGPRRHEQRFNTVVATSLIEPNIVIGFEHGRRSRFALDQYAPFTMYSTEGYLGVRTRPDTAWVDVLEVAPRVYELRSARRNGPNVKHDVAALTVVASHAPIIHEHEMIFGEITLQFPDLVVEVRLPAQRRASE